MIVCTIPNLTTAEKSFLQEPISETVYFAEHFSEVSIPLDQITIFITFGYDLTIKTLDQMTALKWINILQTGIEHLDIENILSRHILLTHTKDIHGIPISEYVLGMILYNVRNIQRFELSKQVRLWDRRELPATEAHGKTVAIFGTGSIGQDIAKLLKALNMKTIGVNTRGDHRPYFDEVYTLEKKHDVLKMSDFIVLIMPATEKTHHCMSHKEFELMKETAYLINVGRGPLIDTDALVTALQEKKIVGAALDVFDEEPLPIDSPLWDLKNIFITPHISSSTDKYNERALLKFLTNYEQFTQNNPLTNQIIDTQGY